MANETITNDVVDKENMTDAEIEIAKESTNARISQAVSKLTSVTLSFSGGLNEIDKQSALTEAQQIGGLLGLRQITDVHHQNSTWHAVLI